MSAEPKGGLLPALEEADLQQAIYGLRGILDALDLIDEEAVPDAQQRLNARANLLAAGKYICQRITDQF